MEADQKEDYGNLDSEGFCEKRNMCIIQACSLEVNQIMCTIVVLGPPKRSKELQRPQVKLVKFEIKIYEASQKAGRRLFFLLSGAVCYML